MMESTRKLYLARSLSESSIGKVYWYKCKCGYESPITTGMMMHLSMYKGQKHRYYEAVKK